MQRLLWNMLDTPLTRALCSPLSVDDYLTAFNPLWSVERTRARIEAVEPETADAVSLWLRPNHNWQGHRAGQHVLLGVQIDGVWHRRCFSLSVPPGTAMLRITVKRNGEGRVSNHLVDHARPGDIVELDGPAGEFVLPEPRPQKLLMISGGSGVTPMLAMARQLVNEGYEGSLVFLHYSRCYDDTIALNEMRELASSFPWLALKLVVTEEAPEAGDHGGFFSAEQLAELVPDAQQRHALLCGPEGMMAQVRQHHAQQPFLALDEEQFAAPGPTTSGEGRVHFLRSGEQVDGGDAGSLLELAESRGLNPRYGCRMGICQECRCHVEQGTVRDLRNDQVRQVRDETVQLCVHAAAGDVHINEL